MLKLTNIKKTYILPNFEVRALDDISVSFRQNEFVSVLGPSGSGKTTLLNIVGGLDKYTSGDLIINGRSTKTFKERDWDVYRNHRIGFVFQSYNLIPHQNVLSNVELALTIAGLNKEQRVQKAKLALDRVGLSDQYYKKPNQLSGGQSQRVAIARALVNDPEILLADEPTGALDTKTSMQILDLIKEIASDRLVIMVTHNQVIAKKYSTRIINLLDGKLVEDSNPVEEALEIKKEKSFKATGKEKAKMSWWTTFKLSLQNLFSKTRRTILTSIASSIGIIGISLVLSLSYGVKAFISNMQEDMLSGNPITVNSNTLDLDKMIDNMGMAEKMKLIKEEGKVNVNKLIEQIAKRASDAQSMFVENNITLEYVNYLSGLSDEDVAAILFDYEVDLKPNLYFDFYETVEGEALNLSLTAIISIYTSILKENEETKSFANLISNFTNIAQKAPTNEEYILNQYDILAGRYAKEKDEVMLVLNNDRSLTDLLLAQLGFYSQEEFLNLIYREIDDVNYDPSVQIKEQFTYEELMEKTFTWHPNDSVFVEPPFYLPNEVKEKAKFWYVHKGENIVTSNDAVELKIVGILEPNENIMYGSLKSGFYYTDELSEHILNTNKDSQIVLEMETNNFSSYTNMPNEQGDMEAVMFLYEFSFQGNTKTAVGFVGNVSVLSNLLGVIMGSSTGNNSLQIPMIYTLTKRDLGGEDLPSKISIYPVDPAHKKNVINYLNEWNNQEHIPDEDKITLTDPLSLIFAMINNMINVITIALIGFTTLALVVSSVMIAIITYVSVVERVKEIGVIRSLGGRKRDVSNLFVAETVIIGLASGLIAISFTYLASFIINLIVHKEIGFNIAVFPITYALMMLSISVLLTLISGLIPSRSAAKKDPVIALRTE